MRSQSDTWQTNLPSEDETVQQQVNPANERSFDGVAITGYGETHFDRHPKTSTIGYLAEALRRTLASAGLEKSEVDGLAVTAYELPPDNVVTVAEHLGMSLRWAHQGAFGGASPIIALAAAARAIQAGEASVVCILAGDAVDVNIHNQRIAHFSSPIQDYLNPYAFAGTNGIFAMVQARHMQQYGTTREQLARLAVSQRANAALNPNALLRQPLTTEAYLNARPIAAPVHLFDCVLPCSGALGIALVGTQRYPARPGHLSHSMVTIRAIGQSHNFRPGSILPLEEGWAKYRTELYDAAGIGPGDIDMVQLYDDYPIMELIQLEDFGFCEKGEGGLFLETTDISLRGQLPINTGGGQLSCGQCGAGGGILGLVEAVRQLRGEAADRQIADARSALVSGFGMVSYGRGLSNSAAILSKE